MTTSRVPGTKQYIPYDKAIGQGRYMVYTPLNASVRAKARKGLINALAAFLRRLADVLDPPRELPSLNEEDVERFLRAWMANEQTA